MFKRFVSRFGWIIFLLLAGVYLLLNNLGVIGPWGDLIWGAFFAAVGLGFLIWSIVDRARWWRVIPGFILLAAGAVIVMESQKITLGNWAGAIVLFGVALAFWALLLRRGDFWWALLPAGVLTVTSLLVGLRAQLSAQVWTAALLIGLGLVFLLLYFLRLGQSDTRWAIIPAGWLLLLGLVMLVGAFNLPSLIDTWWPVLLILAGAGAVGPGDHPPAQGRARGAPEDRAGQGLRYAGARSRRIGYADASGCTGTGAQGRAGSRTGDRHLQTDRAAAQGSQSLNRRQRTQTQGRAHQTPARPAPASALTSTSADHCPFNAFSSFLAYSAACGSWPGPISRNFSNAAMASAFWPLS